MTDTTNPRARLDAALEEMRHTNDCTGDPARVTSWAAVACAEALSLLVDAHLPVAPDPAPAEPEPDPCESLPDDTPVGHGWVMGWGGSALFKPEGNGLFTRRLGTLRKWGVVGAWQEEEVTDPSPATVGDLRRESLPLSEWPDITAPEPGLAEPPEGSVVLVNGIVYQRIINYWYEAGATGAREWDDLCFRNEPTVIHAPKEAP